MFWQASYQEPQQSHPQPSYQGTTITRCFVLWTIIADLSRFWPKFRTQLNHSPSIMLPSRVMMAEVTRPNKDIMVQVTDLNTGEIQEASVSLISYEISSQFFNVLFHSGPGRELNQYQQNQQYQQQQYQQQYRRPVSCIQNFSLLCSSGLDITCNTPLQSDWHCLNNEIYLSNKAGGLVPDLLSVGVC